MTFAAYLGVVDCVEQARLAEAAAVRDAWTCALVAALMGLALCGAAWAAWRMARGRVRRPADAAALAAFAAAMLAYGGSKPHTVTERGIKLTKCEVDAAKAYLEWSSEDERITAGATYMVQKSPDGVEWQTVYSTSGTNATVYGFTVDRDVRWRIAVDLGEVDGEGEE